MRPPANYPFEQEEHHPSWTHAHYKASFFGPFRVLHHTHPLGEPTWRRNKAKALLKWFLLNAGDLFSVEQLSSLFWPAIPLKVAVSNLHVTLHYLRHVLEPDLASGCPSTFIRRNRHNYYWFHLTDTWWTDLADVHYLLTSAQDAERSAHTSRAITLYSQLAAYYRLTFLPEDIYDDIFSPYRRQHEYAQTHALEHLMLLYTHTQRFDDAFSCALQTLSVDPYNEHAITTMVQIHLQQGNTAGALRQLDSFELLLQQDLGSQAGHALRSLRTTIVNSRLPEAPAPRGVRPPQRP